MLESTWRDIANFPGYQVSQRGEVRSLKRNRLLALVPRERGYLAVNLYREGKPHNCLVHRLVAQAFCGDIPPGYHVNHKDGDKANNDASNLEIVTPEENRRHALRTGLIKRGEDNPRAKLTEADVRELRRLHAEGTTVRVLTRRYDLSEHGVYLILRRKTWRHVP
jgi:hypothetical protein